MYYLIIILSILFLTHSIKAEKLTVYTYDSFVSEWGPGPLIEKAFEEKYSVDLELIAVDSAATLLNKVILEGSNTKADIILGLDMNLFNSAENSELFTAHNLNNINEIFYVEFSNAILIYFLAALSIIGHLYPVWLKFKGGKGVATYIGFLFGANYILGIIFISSWLIVSIITKYSSLSSICSLLILPLIIIIFFSFNIQVVCLFFVISGLIIFKHYTNILRLFNKTESKIRF